ncbi:hypothetical protein [Streptosporangium sp. KLBMP 9127]|nr:hypothetical protein [Streptosporangium sp. KLBMP 9127]
MMEITGDVVRILYRLPQKSILEDNAHLYPLTTYINDLRAKELQKLDEAARTEGAGFDPVLHKLRELSEIKREAEDQIRHLVTYARHFVRPRPYQLAKLAEATGVSISGIRLMCSNPAKEEIAINIQKSDISGQFSPPKDSEELEIVPITYKAEIDPDGQSFDECKILDDFF